MNRERFFTLTGADRSFSSHSTFCMSLILTLTFSAHRKQGSIYICEGKLWEINLSIYFNVDICIVSRKRSLGKCNMCNIILLSVLNRHILNWVVKLFLYLSLLFIEWSVRLILLNSSTGRQGGISKTWFNYPTTHFKKLLLHSCMQSQLVCLVLTSVFSVFFKYLYLKRFIK